MLIYGYPIGSSVLFGLLFAALFFGLQCLCFRSGRKYLCFLLIEDILYGCHFVQIFLL